MLSLLATLIGVTSAACVLPLFHCHLERQSSFRFDSGSSGDSAAGRLLSTASRHRVLESRVNSCSSIENDSSLYEQITIRRISVEDFVVNDEDDYVVGEECGGVVSTDNTFEVLSYCDNEIAEFPT